MAQQRAIALQPPAMSLTPQQQNHLVKYMFGLLKDPPPQIRQPGKDAAQQRTMADVSPLIRVFQTASPIHPARLQQVEAGG